jgi:hypothetical protein
MKPFVRRSGCQPIPSIVLQVSLVNSNRSLKRLLARLWQGITTRLLERSELQVWHTCDATGQIWWNAYDPTTGQAIYLVPEAQVLAWIEQRHY